MNASVITRARTTGLAAAATVLLAAYWAFDRLAGPFAAIRRYGMEGARRQMPNLMPTGEWVWWSASFAASGAALLAVLAWRRRRPRNEAPPAGGPPLAVLSFGASRNWVLALAVAAVVGAAVIRAFVLQGAPLCDDEMVYRFQAQTIALGRLTAPPPPDVKSFQNIFLGVVRGRWFGQYSFGHPALLALGELAGAIGAVGPLFVGLVVVLVFLLARRLFDERVARLAAALAAFSPILVSTGGTLLSQNSATPLVLLGVLLTLAAVDSGRFAHALGAALALGAAFWCRQQEPAVLGIGPMLLLLVRAWRGERRKAVWWGVAIGALIAVLPLLLLQWRLWGNPLWTNYQAYWWGHMKVKVLSPFGFGASPWSDDHTAFSGFRNTLQNLVRVDFYLLGLPGALALAVYGFVAPWRRPVAPGADRAARLAVFAGAPLTYALLFFYFWSGLSDTGPQLYHTASAMLLPFLAAGVVRLLDRAGRPLVAAAALLVAAGLTFWPSHLGLLHRAGLAGNEIPRLIAKRGVHRALVFTEKFPWFGGKERTAVLGRPLPHPDLRDDVLYLQSHGTPYDRQVAATHFPDRSLWVLRQIDGLVALLPMDEYTGEDSLRAVAQPRDLPRP